jgi:hypothetical protein
VAIEVDRKHVHELAAYRIVAKFVDRAPLSDTYGRRGATALDYIEPGLEGSRSGRSLWWLPLGKFDVWSGEAQAAIAAEATRFGLSVGQDMHPNVLSLLAATGGRPRDISAVLFNLQAARVPMHRPSFSKMITAFFDLTTSSSLFQRYLLPSMLSMTFDLVGEKSLTQFGVDAAAPALLNADLFVFEKMAVKGEFKLPKPAPVPVVSLRFSECSVADKALRETIGMLISATVFCRLDDSGKDFERAWVLLVFTQLLLQYNVRVGASALMFWPESESGRRLGGPARPTAIAIDVFQRPGIQRVDALFAMLCDSHVCNKPVVQRKIMFGAVPPTLAVWDDLWTPNVCAGHVPDGWSMASSDVVWGASSVVYFTKVTHLAIDFMLLVGDANGTGDARPHVYMFQCEALNAPVTQGSARFESVTVENIVRDFGTTLEMLFTPAFKGHVLRRAGILRRNQVTLCINALQFGARVDASKLTPAFGVVLFDEEEFGALGGAAFANTRFFRFLAQRRPKPAAATQAAATQLSAEAASSSRVRSKRKRSTKAYVDDDE